MLKNFCKKRKRSLTLFLTLIMMSGLIVTAYGYDGITGNMDNTLKRKLGLEIGSASATTNQYSIAQAPGGYLSLGYTSGNLDNMFDNAAYNKKGSVISKSTETASEMNTEWKMSLYVKDINSGATSVSATIKSKLTIQLWDMIALADGSYIAAGYLGYTSGSKINSHTGETWSATIGSVMMDADGNMQTEKTFDVDWHISSNKVFSTDAIMVKLDSDGNIDWIKTMEGYSYEEIVSLAPLSDGGYAVVGQTALDGPTDDVRDMGEFEGKATGIPASPWGENVSAKNAFAAVYNADGDMDWLNMIGGSYNDGLCGITETSDNKLVVVGTTYSYDMKDADGNVLNTHIPSNTADYGKNSDAIIGIMDEEGNYEWIKSLGGTKTEGFTDVVADDNGDFIVSGVTDSNDDDFEGMNLGNKDAVAAAFNVQGDRLWMKTYGGSENDSFKSVARSYEGGLVFAGLTYSSDGIMDESGISGGNDLVLVNTQDNGEAWRITALGGTDEEYMLPLNIAENFNIIVGTSNLLATPTGYLIAGSSKSIEGLFVTTGNQNSVIALASFDYDNDGVADSLDYYPADPTLSAAPKENLNLGTAPVRTLGDSESTTCEITTSDILAPYLGEDGDYHNIKGTDNVSISLAGGTLTLPVQTLSSLLQQTGGTLNFSIDSITSGNLGNINGLLGSDKNILSFDITLTDSQGNAIHELPSDIMLTVNIPANTNISDVSKLALNYYNTDTNKLEVISGANMKLINGNQISFSIPHLSNYVLTQTAAAVSTGSNHALTSSTSTGDHNVTYIWVIMGACALCIIAASLLKYKKVLHNK